MRRFVSVLAVALIAAAPALAQKDPVNPPSQPQRPQQQQPPQTSARDTGVSPPGWRREVNQSGTIYFYCQGNTCQQGDVVSYRVQQEGQRWSLDQFRVQQQRANESMQRDGAVRSVQMSGPRDESHAGTVIYVTDKDLLESNGRQTGMVSTYLAFERQHITVVSTAPTLSQAADNIAPFREALVEWLRNGGR